MHKFSWGTYRHPRTTQEMRAAEIEREGVPVRAKRRAKNLPQVYDDIPVCRLALKSWKARRKQKWSRIHAHQ